MPRQHALWERVEENPLPSEFTLSLSKGESCCLVFLRLIKIAGFGIIWPEMKADYDKESIKKIVVYIAWS